MVGALPFQDAPRCPGKMTAHVQLARAQIWDSGKPIMHSASYTVGLSNNKRLDKKEHYVSDSNYNVANL